MGAPNKAGSWTWITALLALVALVAGAVLGVPASIDPNTNGPVGINPPDSKTAPWPEVQCRQYAAAEDSQPTDGALRDENAIAQLREQCRDVCANYVVKSADKARQYWEDRASDRKLAFGR